MEIVLSGRYPKNACVLPWLHISMDPSGNAHYCCKSDVIRSEDGQPLNFKDHSVMEVWNSSAMKEVRRQMSRGEAPAACRVCFDEERQGQYSNRMVEYTHWVTQKEEIINILKSTQEDGFLPTTPLSYDLRFGNLCNLKCRMCSPHYSSSIQSEYSTLHQRIPDLFKKIETNQDWWEEKNIVQQVKDHGDKVQRLVFVGGEPALSKEVLELLKYFKDQNYGGKVRVEITTNLTNLSDELLETLKHFKTVQIVCSLDGFDQVNSYIRYPSKWPVIEKNLLRYAQLPQAVFILSPVLQIYNAFHFTDVFRYFLKLRQQNIKVKLFPQTLYTPKHLHVSLLTEDLKAVAKNRIVEFAENELSLPWEKQNFLAIARQFDLRLENVPDLRKTFVRYTKALDESRKQNCLDTIPELAPMFCRWICDK